MSAVAGIGGLLRTSELAAVAGGRLVVGAGERAKWITGVSLDSRQTAPGDLFVAIPGERADGHAFLGAAFAAGAVAALVSRWPVEGPAGAAEGRTIVLVRDTGMALGTMAARHRRRFAFRAVGITGSVGKTTTKDLIAAVLAGRFSTLVSEGNLNSDLGLPLVIFRARPEHEVAVLEMAMRGPGEIRHLARIARPEIGVLTNIGQTHLELLGTVEAVAAAKAELIESLPPHGVAVLNADDPWVRRIAGRSTGRLLFYGTGPRTEVRGEDPVSQGDRGVALTIVTPLGRARVSVPLPGLHNVSNILAAAAVGTVFGLAPADMAQSLSEVVAPRMRLQVRSAGGVTVIDDAYNASPASTLAALAVLDEIGSGGRRLFVFGDMLELGPYAARGHQEVGAEVVRRGLDLLVTVGDLAGGAAARAALAAGYPADRVLRCRDNQEVVAGLRERLLPGDTILVKGSRGMKLDEVVSALIVPGNVDP
jgi:UDP-N-acetylmuramoyl-tripeptide--D-alanyl-D-alanine ligase